MKHNTTFLGALALGIGLAFVPRFAPVKSSFGERTAGSSEASTELGASNISSFQPSPSQLHVSGLQLPENGENSLSAQGQGAVQKEMAQDSVGVSFANFKVSVEPDEEELDVKGSFTLGAASNGINLFKEKTAVKVGSLSATIPPGSFKQGSKGKVEFKKLIDCTYWDLFIRTMGKNTFEIKLELQGAREATRIRPEDIFLSIGDDSGPAKPAS